MALERLGPGWTPLVTRALDGFRMRDAHGGDPTGEPRSSELFGERAPVLAEYLDALAEWNARVDLTAARSAEEAVDLALGDALVLAHGGETGSRTASWVDVGAGAGAPGLVLSILRREWPMTLIEPKDRRVAFLRSVIGRLDLKMVRVERGRSERTPPRSFDVAVSRATLSPAEWLDEGARLARRAVWVLLARGDAPSRAGWRVAHDVEYAWPLTGAHRRALMFVPADG